MTEPSKDKLNELLIYLIEQIKNGVEFTKEQAPGVVEEMLRYDSWYYSTIFIAPLFAAVFCIFIILFGMWIEEKTDHPISEFFVGLGSLFLLASFCFSIFFGIKGFMKANQIKTAPRYYLIEKLKGNNCRF